MTIKSERSGRYSQTESKTRLRKKIRQSRRNFLGKILMSAAGLGLAGIAVAAINCQKENYQSTPLPPLDPSKYELSPILVTPALPLRPSNFNLSTVNKSEIEQMWNEAKIPPTLDVSHKLAALPQHVSVIFAEFGPKATGRGTALMIDRSGLFLTARHVISDEKSRPPKAGLVYHPGLNRTLLASQVIFSADGDLGLVYAPTGISRGRLPGIQIATEEIETGMLLRQYGTLFEKGVVSQAQMDGNALDPDFKPFPRYSFRGLRAVYGMVPFGGSSGGPIVSIDKGNVMAVESGFITSKDDLVNDRNRYLGSTIAPVSDMDAVIRNQQLYRL